MAKTKATLRARLKIKTLRAARLLPVAGVGSSLTARFGDARNSPPWPRSKSAAAGPFLIFKQALTAGAFVLATINHVYAQYTPPPPPGPYAGFINEWLRQQNPAMNAWDFGGVERLRFEYHDGYNIPGEPGTPAKANNDFRAQGADVSNSYLMSRLRLHAGYTDKWWSAYVEGQSSLVYNDDRWAYFAKPTPKGEVNRQADGPESDKINLHQAYVTVGNLNEFPLAVKVGRQYLTYGEERLVGAYDWNNISRTFDAAKLTLQTEWVAADFFTSRVVIPQDEHFDTDNDHEMFSGVYATTAKIPPNTLDLYFLSRNASSAALTDVPSPQFPQPGARDVYTAGGRIKSKPGDIGNFDYSFEGAYQFGNFRDTRAGAPTTRLGRTLLWQLFKAAILFRISGPSRASARNSIMLPATTTRRTERMGLSTICFPRTTSFMGRWILFHSETSSTLE
jgi:hypothetical protein